MSRETTAGVIILAKIKAHLKCIKLAVKWLFKTNLGNTVIYHGTKYTVVNGVYSGCWTLQNSYERIEQAPISQCSFIWWNPREYIHSIRSGLNFYYGYWYEIFVMEFLK